MNSIQDIINKFWGGIIEFYEFNILKNTIKLDITVVDNEERSKYCIIFKGVSSYHFYKDAKEERLNIMDPDEGDFLELTSVYFYESGVGKTSINSKSEKWIEQYYSNSNFILEIWSSILCIETNKIIIDGIEYECR